MNSIEEMSKQLGMTYEECLRLRRVASLNCLNWEYALIVGGLLDMGEKTYAQMAAEEFLERASGMLQRCETLLSC